METIIYDFKTTPPTRISIDTNEMMVNIRRAAYRFWVSEYRMPAALVIPLQLAQVVTGSSSFKLIGELYYYGMVKLDEITSVPVLARDAHVDPLFQFI